MAQEDVSPPSRRWCFTIWSRDVWERLLDFEGLPEDVRFVFGQLEHGRGGRTHWQGYLELRRPQRRSWIKTWLRHEGVHCLPARGTSEQNVVYCSKEDGRDGGPWSFGTPGAGAGQRTDVEAAKDMLDDGASTIEIAEACFPTWIRYHKAFNIYSELRAARAGQEQREMPNVCVLWGRTGSGKSHRADLEAGDQAWWWSPPSSKGGPCWFDGYGGEPNVIFDDFDGDSIPLGLLLRLLDKYRLRLAIKGGFVTCQFKRVWITSNYSPESWYRSLDQDDDRRGALLRRLTHVHHMDVDWIPIHAANLY